MKGMLFKTTAALLCLLLYCGGGAGQILAAEQTAEKPGIVYTPVPHNGLPVTVSVARIKTQSELVYTYSGSKTIVCDFKTPNVSLSAVSGTPLMSASVRQNNLYIENKGLHVGESATVTLTAKHKDFAPVVQEITITLTDGTSAYPHLISTKEDFLALKATGVYLNYIQTADISLNGIREWEVIGTEAMPFTGVYDGGGNKITGMDFSEIDSERPSLFGYVYGHRAEIKNLHVEGNIHPRQYAPSAHGTIAGMVDGATISGCSFTGSMTLRSTEMKAGGIAADVMNGGTLKDCKFIGKLKTYNTFSYVGGIVGIVNGTVEGCSFEGELVSETTGKEANVGGIAGTNLGLITGCAVNADISAYGSDGYFGGVSGFNRSEIRDSSYSGKLYSKGNTKWVGGITSSNLGVIYGCAVEGELEYNGKNTYAGGIAGRNECGTIENSTSDMNISGQGMLSRAGGIAGENYSYINHNNFRAKTTSLALISHCSYSGSLSIKDVQSFGGGIAGRNYGFSIVAGGSPENAKTLIEKCIVLSDSIDSENGAKAGRVVAENLLAGVTAGEYATKVHPVVLSENGASKKTLVNGAIPEAGASPNGINGQTLDAAKLAEFEKALNIQPGAVAEEAE